jgi:fibronectin-binding autotransporter adhesin
METVISVDARRSIYLLTVKLMSTSMLAGVAMLGSISGAAAVTVLTVSDAATLASALTTVNANPGTSYQLNITAPVMLLSTNAISTTTAVNVAGGGALDINNFNQSIGALTGSGTILLENNVLTFGNDNSSTTLAATVHGNVGNGYLVKAGTGTLTLSSTNMDTGEFHVFSGSVVQATGASAIRYTAVGSGTGANATMTLSGGTYTVSNAIQVGDFGGVGVFNQTGGAIALNGSLNIGNQGGTGTYNLSGGTLALVSGLYDIGRNSGANPTSHGTMNISGGLVDVQGGTFILGDRVAPASGTPSSGIVAQTGGTMRIGAAAALFLSGYGQGEYDLNGGTLAVGGTGLSANYAGGGAAYAFKLGGGTLQSYGTALTATLNATLTTGTVSTFDTNGLGMSWSGNLTGGGGLNKAGAGTLTLSGTDSYTGGTTISAGTLQLGSAGALPTGQAVTINGGALDLNGNSASIGSLSGTSGTAILGAAALAVGSDNSSTSYAGTFSGTGVFTKTGSGTLTLSGNSATFAGSTIVTGGGLALSGAKLGGSVATNSGATLSGTGSIGGNYTQHSGATLIVQATPSSATSLTVGGAASLAGALSVQATPGVYSAASTYRILSAASVAGSFGTVTSNLAFLAPSVSYSGAGVDLTLTRNSTSVATVAGTPNQRAVGAALDKLSVNNSPAALSPFFNALLGQSTAQATATLDHVGGNAQIASVTTSVSIDAGQRFATTMLQAPGIEGGGRQSALAAPQRLEFASADPLDAQAQIAEYRSTTAKSRWGAWANGNGVSGSIAGDGNASGVSYSTAGGAFGVDYRLTPSLLIGLSAGYARTDASINVIGGSDTVDSSSFGLYSGYRSGPFYAIGSLGYAYNDQTVKRVVAVSGLATSTATASPHADQFLSAAEIGYDLKVRYGITVTPLAGVQATVISQEGYTESGAGALDLTVGSKTTNSVRALAGARIAKSFALGAGQAITFESHAAWAHELTSDDRAVSAQFAAAPGTGFIVDGARPKRDSAVVEVGVAAPLSNMLSLYLRYDGDLNGSDDAHGVSGGLRLSW